MLPQYCFILFFGDEINMNQFEIFEFTSKAYTDEECITGSENLPNEFIDISRQVQNHKNIKHIMVSNLTQSEFDDFVENYADDYLSIYFFHNTKVKDLSVLSGLKNVEYLIFYNMRAKSLWDMSRNYGLKGLDISESKGMVYDLSEVSNAPALVEFVLTSSMHRKYIVKSLNPIVENSSLKRVLVECNTELKDFDPNDFSSFDYFKYRVDKYSNFKL